MRKGNVLVIGRSGVGKSTLINSVLGDDVASAGFGTEGTTKELKVYGNPKKDPFCLIDTIGFVPTFIGTQKAIRAVKKWSAECAKEDNNQINVIWFCVEGTASKLFPKEIESLSKATKMWPSVPIIVVITKSYSVPERKKNIEMVQNAFAEQKASKKLKKIIPVVASTFELNETAYAAPEGITELIEVTNELMPEGLQAAKKDLEQFKLNRKRYLAQGTVGVSTASGVAIGAVPIPFADATLLTPLEIAEVNAIAKIYGIKNDAQAKQFINSIVEAGTISVAAKSAISALKAIPGITLGASALNAVIAGSIIAALGETTIYAFEQVHLGNKTFEDIDWLKKLLESKLSVELIETVKKIMDEINDSTDLKEVAKTIAKSFSNN